MATSAKKTQALLSFLKATATLRRKPIKSYGSSESKTVLWLESARNLAEIDPKACKSAFFAEKPEDAPDIWLEVRKKPKPTLVKLPKELQDWVPQEFQTHPDKYIHKKQDELLGLLNTEIIVLVEQPVSNPDTPSDKARKQTVQVPETRYLKDFPEIKEAWGNYLETHWMPWAQEMRRRELIQELYEHVDFMRRRLEEAEERYELLLAVGLLQWRDSSDATVKRHLLTAPAEISLDAAHGVLTVRPADSFETFRVELDMLDPKDQPSLKNTNLENLLEDLDIRAWDKTSVAEILRIIANRAKADNEVYEDSWMPTERADKTFRILYAPAIVLRERRPTAYEELVSRLAEMTAAKSAQATTAPWERFISEGEPPAHSAVDEPDAAFPLDVENDRLFFPLPTNEEQRRIIERLRVRPYVLVKGPPGTGKSHTIANLICHLLATGERVLVTAHAPKALTVLRDLLPEDIRNLCVTALGSSREDYRLLEESVRGILSQKNQWQGKAWAQEKIDRLEKELHQLEEDRAKLDRELRECREAETHFHTLFGGYQGTAAQIAKRIEKEREAFSWFPKPPDGDTYCPLEPQEINFLADFYSTLTEERLNELRLEIGTFFLPDPDEFESTIQKLVSAKREAEAACAGLPEGCLNGLQRVADPNLKVCREFLKKLQEHTARAQRLLGDKMTSDILKDLLVGRTARWDRLAEEVNELLKQIREAHKRVGTASIHLSPDVDDAKLLADTRRRLEHFMNGGWRGWGFLAPRVVRKTRYIEKVCRVDGEAPHERESLDKLLGFLELRTHIQRFFTIWPAGNNPGYDDPRQATDEVFELCQELHCLLECFKTVDPKALDVFPVEKRVNLAEQEERALWGRILEAELALRRARQAQDSLNSWSHAIHTLLAQKKAHPCMSELAQAIDDHDPVKWRVAWNKRKGLRAAQERLHLYQLLLEKLRKTCPDVVIQLQKAVADPEWINRLRQFEQAWAWAVAKAWLRKVTDPKRYEQLAEKRQRLQADIEDKIRELAAAKAWQAFFARLDDQGEQYLIAWTKAVARIGKGTGKHAMKHRRTARRYLMACIPKIPCWIMPLHKLWETTDPAPGIFDTVIVDEASQAGI